MGVLCQLYTKFDSTASSASSWASSSHSTTSFASWASSSDSTATFSPLRQVDPGLCALKMAATCSRFFARVVLKIPFSSSHSKGSRCKRLVSFLAKSALMLSTGVTLSFSSIEPKICPATSIEVKFPKRWRALCLGRLFFGFSDLPLIFLLSSWHCWFSRAQRKLLWQVNMRCCQLVGCGLKFLVQCSDSPMCFF